MTGLFIDLLGTEMTTCGISWDSALGISDAFKVPPPTTIPSFPCPCTLSSFIGACVLASAGLAMESESCALSEVETERVRIELIPDDMRLRLRWLPLKFGFALWSLLR